jgi:hypothetical protein
MAEARVDNQTISQKTVEFTKSADRLRTAIGDLSKNVLKKDLSDAEKEAGISRVLKKLYQEDPAFKNAWDKGTEAKHDLYWGYILYCGMREGSDYEKIQALKSGSLIEIGKYLPSDIHSDVLKRIRKIVVSNNKLSGLIDKYEKENMNFKDLVSEVEEIKKIRNNLPKKDRYQVDMILGTLEVRMDDLMNKNNVEKVEENVETQYGENSLLKKKTELMVNVERGNGIIENDWEVLGIDGDMVVVGKQENGRDIMKKMPMEIFSKLNSDYLDRRNKVKSVNDQKENEIKEITVNVERSDGRKESDWTVLDIGGDIVVVTKKENGKDIMKKMPIKMFYKLNPDYLDRRTEKNIAVKEEENKEDSASLEDLLNTVKQSNESVPEVKDKEQNGSGKEESVPTLDDLLETTKGPGNNTEVKMSEEKINSKVDQLRMMINKGIESGKRLTEEGVKKYCMENGIKYTMVDYENGKFTISIFSTNNILLEDNNEFYVMPSPDLLKPDFYKLFYVCKDIEDRSLIAMDFIAKIESFTKLVKQGNGYEVEKKGLLITKPSEENEKFYYEKKVGVGEKTIEPVEKLSPKMEELNILMNKLIEEGRAMSGYDIEKYCMENGLRFQGLDDEEPGSKDAVFHESSGHQHFFVEDNGEYFLIPYYKNEISFLDKYYDQKDYMDRSAFVCEHDVLLKIVSLTKLRKEGSKYVIEKKGLVITKAR